jgi:FkbM family methyltransferase
MAMISYAQNGEDVRLNRIFGGQSTGFYIDIGACDPLLDSVTKHFYDAGWLGINVEPGDQAFRALEAARPRDRNHHVGLSDRPGLRMFHEAVDSLGMSSFNEDFVGGLRRDGYACRAREVEVRTLSQLCEEEVGARAIDFLKIDVEGHEREVIAGGDWTRWRPCVVLVEATIHPESWEPILLAADYRFATFDGLNRFYVRAEEREWIERLAAPLSILDGYEPYALVRLRAERDALGAECAALRERLTPFEDLGPASLDLARHARRIASRFPRFASSWKRWTGSRAG